MFASNRPAHGAGLVKRKVLGDNERVRWATHESKWLVFPGLILRLILVAIADYWLWSGVYPSLPSIPYATAFLVKGTQVIPYLGTAVFWVAVALAVAGAAYAVIRVWRWLKNVFAVTNFRVLHQIGVMGTNFEEIPLVQIRDVDVDQTFWQRILGVGWVRINSLQYAAPGSVPVDGQPIKPHHHRRPDGSPGLEVWWYVPHPYAIEKEVESQTEVLVVGRANTPPPIPVR